MQMRQKIEIDDRPAYPRLPVLQVGGVIERAKKRIERRAQPVADDPVAMLDQRVGDPGNP